MLFKNILHIFLRIIDFPKALLNIFKESELRLFYQTSRSTPEILSEANETSTQELGFSFETVCQSSLQ